MAPLERSVRSANGSAISKTILGQCGFTDASEAASRGRTEIDFPRR
jgi:hypothetical protein